MPDLPPGIYEQLVTLDLHRRLSRLDPTLVDREGLEPVDAHEVLARHLGQLARQALRFESERCIMTSRYWRGHG